MKIIGLVLGLFLSVSAFTDTYSGAGDWKSNREEFGTYTVLATIEAGDDNTIMISQTLTFENEVLNFGVVLQKLDDNFYDVFNDQGEYIGEGYCWPLPAENEKICHTETIEQGFFVESTIKKTANVIYRIGSKTNLENDEKIIWKDELLLQNNG